VPEPLVLELVAAVLDAGAPVEQAIEAVAGALDGAGDRATDLRAGDLGCAAMLRELTALSGSTGLPLAGLVRAAAADRRRALGAAQAKAAHRLAVLLVLPTGLCLLPAFILLGVVPLVLDLLVGL
jgi:tight adherence protein B